MPSSLLMMRLALSSKDVPEGLPSISELAPCFSVERIANDRVERKKLYDLMWKLRERMDEIKRTPLNMRQKGAMVEWLKCKLEGIALKQRYLQLPAYNGVRDLMIADKEKLEACVCRLITDVYLVLNFTQTLKIDQIRPIAQSIISESKGLTIEDLAICFDKGKKGQYGKEFRLDSHVLLGWLYKYKDDRQTLLANQQTQLYLSNRFSGDKRMSGRFKDIRKTI